MTDLGKSDSPDQAASFSIGFWRRHFSGGLLIAFCSLLGLAVLPAAFRRDTRENLLKLEGHLAGLRYFPAAGVAAGAGSGGSGRIEFDLAELPEARFRAENLKEVDELLFVSREKAGTYLQLHVEREKWEQEARPSPFPIVGLQSSRGIYLAPPDVAATLSLDRMGARVLALLLLAVIAAAGVHLRGAHALERETDPKVLEGVVDPILSEIAGWPGLRRLPLALFAEARRVESSEDSRKKASRATVQKASSKPMRAVEMLIRSGANLNAQNARGETPLVLAVKAGSLEAVQVLLQHRADPNLADGEGWTALMHAADQGELGICQRLLASGAQPDVRRNDGKTALELAQASDRKNPAVIAALERAMTLGQASERARTIPPEGE